MLPTAKKTNLIQKQQIISSFRKIRHITFLARESVNM